VNAGSLFGQAAGLAVLAAVYPAAMLIAALYLSSERPGKTTVWFVVGGLLKVTAVGIVLLLVIRAGGLSRIGHSHHQVRYGLRLGLGVIAIIASVVLYRRRGPEPKPSDAAKAKKPNLIQRMTAQPRPLAAFAVGAVIFGQSVTFIAAVQVVATANTSLADTIAAMAMIIVLTIAFAWLPLIAYLIAPAGTIRTLAAVDTWLKRHGKALLTAAIGIAGIFLVIQGITGLI
jgi:hypothetical protein